MNNRQMEGKHTAPAFQQTLWQAWVWMGAA